MRTSFDWVRRHAFRALDAADAAPGVDEDSAYGVAWLEASGFPGLTMLADALDTSTGEERSQGLTPDPAGQIDGGGRSCLFFAPSVIDYLVAQALAQGGSAKVAIQHATHPLALVAGAARFCPPGYAIDISWPGARGDVCAHISGKTVTIDGTDAWGDAKAVDTIMLSVGTAPAGHGDTADTPLRQHFDRSMQRGVEVDDEAFARVSAYAAGVLVPESEDSRAHGAGAGLTDND